jgi:hypothetical protein
VLHLKAQLCAYHEMFFIMTIASLFPAFACMASSWFLSLPDHQDTIETSLAAVETVFKP